VNSFTFEKPNIIPQVALLPSMHYLFVPTHNPEHKHWFSILVDFRRRTICSYDSLGPTDMATRFCMALLTHMRALARKRGGESHLPHHWKLNIDSSFPIQQNQNDCGPSVCVAMFKAFRGKSPSSFNTLDMPAWRESIAAYLDRNHEH
jgi:Ulp1 family protease